MSKGARIPRAVLPKTAKEAPEEPELPPNVDVPDGCMVFFVVLVGAVWRILCN